MWPFDSSSEKRANEAIDRLDRKVSELIQSEQRAVQTLAAKEKALAEAAAAIDKLRQQVRSQTEADLYLTSAKIMRDIMEKGRANTNDVSRQANLQSQLADLVAQCNYASAQGGAFSSLGSLGGAFGL